MIDSMAKMMQNLVSVSDFNKGDAGKIFDSVKFTNTPKLVLRRNEPECVLMSPKNYQEIMEELENLRDYKLATERLKEAEGAPRIPQEEILKDLNITQEMIDNAEDIELG